MGSVFRKCYTKPVPAGAERFVRKGVHHIRWKDSKGSVRVGRLTRGANGVERVRVEAETYTAKYRDGADHIVEVATGCRSRDGAMSVLRDLMARAEKVRASIISASEDAIVDHQQTPLKTHAADYIDHLKARGLTRTHWQNYERCLKRVSKECRFVWLRDMKRLAFERWMAARCKEGMSARNRNIHREAIVAFCN